MENNEQVMSKSFSKWKISLAVLLGLGFTVFMLTRALTKREYMFVGKNTGTHVWQDYNKNLKVDRSEPLEFRKKTVGDFKGDYKEKQLKDVLKEIKWTANSWIWIAIACVCMVGRDLFYIIRIRLLTNKQLSWKQAFNTILIWEFASALSPGVVGGAAVAMFILNKEKIPLGKSTAIVVITALMDNLFYILLIPIVFLIVGNISLFPANASISGSVQTIFWIGYGAMFSICLILYLSIFKYPKLLSSLLNAIFKVPFLKRWKEKAAKTGLEIETTSIEFRTEKRSFWLKVFGSTALSWTCRFLVINCVLQAFIQLGFLKHLLILAKQLVLWLFLIISPTPGASGIAEYAFGELLSDIGVSTLLIAGLAILWRLISYFPYLIIGAVLLPRWLNKKGK